MKMFVCLASEFVARYLLSKTFDEFAKSWEGTAEKSISQAVRSLKCRRPKTQRNPTSREIRRLTLEIQRGWTREEELERRSYRSHKLLEE